MSDLPSSLVLSIEQLDRIDRCLNDLLWEAEARCVLLAEISGQLIGEKGRFDHMNTAVLSALAAGELAATKELARLVGEPARFKLLLHEGERQCVYLSDVGEEMILVTVFDTTTPIGLVRLYVRKIIGELLEVVRTPPRAESNDEVLLDNDFGDLLASQFDMLFDSD